MGVLEFLQVAMPLFLYLAAIVLLIVLIIICIKLIKLMDKVNEIADDVDKKVKSLNGIFNVIDFFTDKISSITDKVVTKITDFVIGIGKRKYNKKERKEDINE